MNSKGNIDKREQKMKELQKINVDKEEIYREFKDLVAIDSLSFQEREMADRLTEKLRELGFEVSEDEAGEEIGGNAGNLYGFLKGSIPGKPILLSAHMDTVCPGNGKRAFVDEEGKITSEADTILGADDVAGIVEILEGIRSVRRAGQAHRDIEVVFFTAEELYTRGSSAFDYSKIKAEEAYVLDLSGPVGTAAYRAPTLISFTASILGKSAHAGFEPENGIHAIAIMGQILTQISQGHLDEETTLNIGTISGGTAANIVPDRCRIEGEIRSYRHERALQCLETVRSIFEKNAGAGNALVEFDYVIRLEAYETAKEEPCIRHFQDACAALKLPGELVQTFGGSDNNSFAKHHIPGLVLSCGMQQAHSIQEYIRIEDLKLGSELIAQLITQGDR